MFLCLRTCSPLPLVRWTRLIFSSCLLLAAGFAHGQNLSATWTQGQRLMPDFTGTLTIANQSSSPLTNYYVEFEWDPYYTQVTTYSGTLTELGNNRYRWAPPAWGTTALAAGASVEVSLVAKYAGITVLPFNARLHSDDGEAALSVVNQSPLFASPCGQPDCAPAAGYDPAQKIIAYYISWGVYGRDFPVENLRADKMTHINFAFANIDAATYRIKIGDEFSDLQKEGGSLDKLYQLKQYYPHLKTLISVGGWTWSTHFYEAAATPANRQAFAASVREFLVKYKFDGVDLDWEYPGGGGNDAGKGSAQDGVNYTLLVQAIRSELDAQEAIDGQEYLITAALGAGTSKINAMDVPGFFSVVDWANLMTYDMNGAWGNYTGHHAPLFNSAGDGVGSNADGSPVIDPRNTVSTAVAHYREKGAPASKITIGLPIYSREWRNVPAGSTNGLYQPSSASQPPAGSWDEPGVPSGVHDYKDLVSDYINKNGYARYWDDVAQVPYLYNPNQLGGHFISYEDVQSIERKTDYIQAQGLAGAMYWEATEDVPSGPNSLIDKIYQGVMEGGCQDNCPNQVPTVRITAPANNATITQGASVEVTATASDPDGSISQVAFFDGTTALGTDNEAPYTLPWTNASLGTHTLTAVATDNEGATTTSAAITVTVAEEGENLPPTAQLTSPAAGATYATGETVRLAADATDEDGTVASVTFFNGTTLLGESTSAPFRFDWNDVAVGTYTLTAVATDNEGATTTSVAVTISVEEGTGSDCNGLPQYAAGSTYTQNQVVANEGSTYNCNIPGWCSSGAAWAYAPGTGQHWQDAWSLVGTCGDGGGDDGSGNDGGDGDASTCEGIATYQAGTGYSQGEEVSNEGSRYSCDIPGWCSSSAAWAYAPGTGQHWQDAWSLVGTCGNGGGDDGGNGNGNSVPSVSITAPAAGATFTSGTAVTIAATASDSDGSIAEVAFFRNGTRLGTDATAPYSFVWNAASAGSYSLTAVATDNQGATTTSAAVNVTVTTSGNDGGGDGPLADRLLVGYWHNFDNGSSTPTLRQVSDKWDVINVAFAEPTVPLGATMTFTPDPFIYPNAQAFKDDIAYLQSQGKKVLISMGGANGAIEVNSASAAQSFSSSMINIVNQYGFDGIDIDLEGNSLSLAAGDNDFRNPVSPKIAYFIEGVQTILAQYDADFMLSMAPETAYVQGGYSTYAGVYGAYLPVIYAFRDRMNYIHVQHYNSGCLLGLDGICYSQGTADFHVAMGEMLLTGFPVAGNSIAFPALRPDQVAIGLPASPSAASGGYTPPAVVHQALDYLIKGISFGGRYTLRNPAGYYNLRGLMTWSINWDIVNGYDFSNSHRAYLDALDASSATTARAASGTSKGGRVIDRVDEHSVVTYPNPFTTSSKLSFSLRTSAFTTLSVYNSLGIKVATLVQGQLESGLHTYEWTPQGAASGVYFYRLSSGNRSHTFKVQKE